MNEPESSPGAEDVGRALLAWYRAAGVDDALGDIAIDWLTRPEQGPGAGFRLAESAPSGPPASLPAVRADRGAPGPNNLRPASEARRPIGGGGGAESHAPSPGQPAAAHPAAGRQFPTGSPDEAVMSARSAAREAPDLDALRAKLEGFNGCALKATAKHLCFYRGAPRARLMIIGEAPGREEDQTGTPFVGPAGQLLDRMLAAIGLTAAEVHVTNTVYWRPPGNRTPSPQETLACRPFLDRQIELVEPEVIALLGGAAANNVLGLAGGIMKLRGAWREIDVGDRKFKTMASLHPAFLLRSPAYKRQAWRDMLAIADALALPMHSGR